MLRVSEIRICLKVRRSFFTFSAILEEPRRCRSLVCHSLAPSLRNKYIRPCTDILIQKQHCSGRLHRPCSVCPVSPSHGRGGGGGSQGAGTRWSPQGCAKVLAFWRERDPHINPPEGRRQSSGMGVHLHPKDPSPGSGPAATSDSHPGCASWQDRQGLARRPGGRVSTGPGSVVPAGLGEAGLGGGLRGPHAPPQGLLRRGSGGSWGSAGPAFYLLRSETVKVYVNKQ